MGLTQVAAIFPGQGSQHVGMAKELYQNFKLAREIFEEASDAAHLDLKQLCFDGPERDLILTENTQPCLLVASIVCYRVAVAETGFRPHFVAGHSLGEYSALVAVGALSLTHATVWVRERGRAMQEAVPAGQGAMAAILGLEDSIIGELCKTATQTAKEKRSSADTDDYSVDAVVEPANFNAPGQIVIAGSSDGIAEAVALIKAGGEFSGGRAIPLQVSAPFHCRLMSKARERMAELFALTTEAEKPRAFQCPYVPNRTARPTREAGLVFQLLIEQVDHPVLWRQSVECLLQDGMDSVVEFGPGKVLTGLVKRISQPLGQASGQAWGKAPTLFQMSESAHLKTLASALASP